ncbi:MAG TPA: hypothetical protein DCP75_08145 [Haliea salexigens]|uniref:Uncharacterized protein n=1 Tax=Haliea salexigens TaxID=287487 RepID=A0A3C1KN90_9GAMM|nr:hypothetical protein [Haliea sp.]HAN27676.1 hypothetical protein [Haliea salexigens]|tara:strand:- start:186 stop:443 length:258 start_codon:yes stop_codon:yes gene_type:complete
MDTTDKASLKIEMISNLQLKLQTAAEGVEGLGSALSDGLNTNDQEVELLHRAVQSLGSHVGGMAADLRELLDSLVNDLYPQEVGQ